MHSSSILNRVRRAGRNRRGALLLGTLLVAVLAVGCQHGPPPVRGPATIEVFATTPITSEVTDYQDFTGRLEAIKSVDIRSRVSGYVQDTPFKEGDDVHEGDVLFQIDPRPFQADLNQAEANLKLAEADWRLQEQNAQRARRLIGGRSIAQEEYDQSMAAAAKAKASVGAMQAARDRARLYLDFTRVIAPLSGRISRRYVDPGNLVNADNTMLTTIVTESPMYAYFDVDERTYLELLASATPSKTSWLGASPQFPVLMRLANEDDFTRSGAIDFIDNRVIATTGTVRMRGVFNNPNRALKAGLFVRIRLPIGAPYKALVISDEAILSDQGRKYVYILNDKDEVVYRPVKLGQAMHGLRVIKEGLSQGERIVVSGMQRVRPGAKVQPTMQEPPKPPESPLVKLLTRLPGGGDKDTRTQGHKETTKQGVPPTQPGG
jgi:RND family efflux transporter MFP subunit